MSKPKIIIGRERNTRIDMLGRGDFFRAPGRPGAFMHVGWQDGRVLGVRLGWRGADAFRPDTKVTPLNLILAEFEERDVGY